jgi:rhodanese-related sulfurtransferase
MDFFVNNWVLIVVAFGTGAMLVWPAVSAGPRAGSVTVTEAVNLINREKAVVIDVSEPDEYSKGHLGGAKNLPFGQVEEKLAGVVKNKATPVILVCVNGTRSGKAVAFAKKAGFATASSLQGGLSAWRAASMPVESGA